MIKLERVYDAVRCAGPTSALRSSDLADGDVPTPAGHRTSDDPLEAVIAQLLTTLGIELDNQHFRRTPVRVAKFYREFTRGYVARPADILKTFRSANRDLIVVSNIDFYSLCPHHLLIYGGRMHFGYVPEGLIAGVSKIPQARARACRSDGGAGGSRRRHRRRVHGGCETARLRRQGDRPS